MEISGGARYRGKEAIRDNEEKPMSTTIRLSCENGHTATFVLDKVNITSMRSDDIAADDPCPKCGAKLCAPAGQFELNAQGVLRRVEERDPESSVEAPAEAVV
jgi:hypothetical protein